MVQSADGKQRNTSKKRRRSPAGTAANKLPTDQSSESVARSSLPPSQVLIIDNGGDTLKYGWSTDEAPSYLPNVTARLPYQATVLVGDELGRVQNPNSLIGVTRSMERGLICDMGNQTQVWKRLLDLLGVTITLTSEAAGAFGWKVASRNTNSGVPPKTIPPSTIAVLLLLPPHCPRLLLDQILNVWMEDFGVSHVGFGISTVCAAREHASWKTACTVDLGWSSTLIVPSFQQNPLITRRCPIGGRHMVNMMKYYISYRQYNLMDQETILRDVFEKLSYISLDFHGEMKMARRKPSGRRPYDRDYVLPDYQTTQRGQIRLPYALQKELERQEEKDGDEEDADEDDADFDGEDEDFMQVDESDDADETDLKNGPPHDNDVAEVDEEDDDEEDESDEQKRRRILQERAEEERRRRQAEDEEQLLRVSVERFSIPEVLFRPFDAGIQTDLVGLAEAIVQAVSSCPVFFHPALYQNVRLTGGLAQIPNLKAGLERELRALVPSEYDLVIELSETPKAGAWLGAKARVETSPVGSWCVSYEEWSTAGKRKAYSRLLVGSGGMYL